MFHLIQLLKMLSTQQRQEFVMLFNDISYELDELGYRDFPEELINDMLFNHCGIEIESQSQLELLSACIVRSQGKLDNLNRMV